MEFSDEEIASWDYAKLWDKFPVPARPSKEELKFLEIELKSLKPKNVLILGSTIEYRSLCKRLGIMPFVADFSKSNYKMLSKYSKEKFPHEHFIETDWLEMKGKNKYDTILGHRAFNVIGRNQINGFFKLMFKILKPDGVAYCKGNIQFQNGDDLLMLVNKWSFNKKRKYKLFSYIEVTLYFHCADKNGYVDYPKARRLMREMYEKGDIGKKDYEFIKILISMSSEARFRGKISKKELKAAIRKTMFKDEWKILDREICSNMPIIKLVKSSKQSDSR